MFHNELHLKIDEVAARVMSGGDADFDELDAHAARGCSICARALVNAQDRTVDVAFGASVAPRRALRERVLGAARLRAGRAVVTPPVSGVRVPDPSAAVAHLHIGSPGEAERIAFIDRVAALEPRTGDAAPRLLVEVERLTRFPLLFVSIVRGERVGYRVQRGLGEPFARSRDLRREITFCTHCVASGLPLVVPDAGREPFFRASKMVTRYGVQAYVGVPLRASDGVVFGTLCGLDFASRAVTPSLVRLLQLYAEPIAAEVEDVAKDRVEPLRRGRFAHRSGWFERLLDLEIERAAASTALLTVDGPRAAELADAADEGEPIGRVGPSALGLLLPGASLAEAARRAGEIRARAGGLEVRFAIASGAEKRAGKLQGGGAELREKALGKG
jgi:GAF domain-containing protein